MNTKVTELLRTKTLAFDSRLSIATARQKLLELCDKIEELEGELIILRVTKRGSTNGKG